VASVVCSFAVLLGQQAFDAREAFFERPVAVFVDAEVLARFEDLGAGGLPVVALVPNAGFGSECGRFCRVDLVGDSVCLDCLSGLVPFLPLGWLVLAGAFAEDAHDVLGGMLDCALGFPLYGLSERALGFSQLLAGAWVLSMPTCRVVGTVVNLGELGLRTPPALTRSASVVFAVAQARGDLLSLLAATSERAHPCKLASGALSVGVPAVTRGLEALHVTFE
jgi:hypothetical protein